MIKTLLKKVIEPTGFIMRKHTPTAEIKDFISKLHPFKTDRELIRLGPDGDGGYLIPNDLQGVKACFSPGVDTISEFEKDCYDLGIRIFLADNSVDKPNISIPAEHYNFLKKHIGCTNNDVFMTMDHWVNSSGLNENEELLLQMDIEGGEYHSVINMSNALIERFRIMVIEFHTLEELWDIHFFKMAQAVFAKILQTHVCVHIHPNNDRGIFKYKGIEIPRTAEFTFYRSDRQIWKEYQTKFPHILDFDNSDKKHVALPPIWYQNGAIK